MAAPIVGVSLKMYFGIAETVAWCEAIRADVARSPVEFFVAPPAVAIPAVVSALAGTGALVGAQNLWHEDRGAYTGEQGGPLLAEAGCSLVEIGHAERRRLFGETDALVALKVAAALRSGLTPLLCVGEERRGDPDVAADRCAEQLDAALAVAAERGLSGRVLVAYEPIWAIGTAEPASAAHVATVATRLRAGLSGHPVASSSGVLYGGSAGLGTLTALGGAVDGIFLGRYAHDPRALAAVLDEAASVNGGSETRKTPTGSDDEA